MDIFAKCAVMQHRQHKPSFSQKCPCVRVSNAAVGWCAVDMQGEGTMGGL
jgi:hypothetical protein